MGGRGLNGFQNSIDVSRAIASSLVYFIRIVLLSTLSLLLDCLEVLPPCLHMDKVQKFISTKEVRDVLDRGIPIIVVTRPPEQDQVGNTYWHRKCVELLEENGIRVVTVKEPRLHFKAVIIDDEILYIGSINPLSVVTVREIPSDYMIRFESEALVDEIVENAIGEKTYEEWLKS